MHFCSYTSWPSRTLPLPFGKPAPLGGMLMSKRAIRSSVAGSPSAGPLTVVAGGVAQAARAKSAMAACLRVDIFHAPVGFHRQRDDRVVVETVVGRVARDPLLARRLHATFLIGGAALQHRRLSGPLPRHAKAHEAARALFAIELGLAPRRAAVAGHLDAADTSGA